MLTSSIANAFFRLQYDSVWSRRLLLNQSYLSFLHKMKVLRIAVTSLSGITELVSIPLEEMRTCSRLGTWQKESLSLTDRTRSVVMKSYFWHFFAYTGSEGSQSLQTCDSQSRTRRYKKWMEKLSKKKTLSINLERYIRHDWRRLYHYVSISIVILRNFKF